MLYIRRQDPWECLLSFICSSNNNIGRIGKMVAGLAAAFGEPLVLGDRTFHDFPTLPALAGEAAKVCPPSSPSFHSS